MATTKRQAGARTTTSATIRRGDIVKVGPWYGIVKRVNVDMDGGVALIQFVKNIIKQQAPEWVELGGRLPVERASMNDMLHEYHDTLVRIEESWRELIA